MKNKRTLLAILLAALLTIPVTAYTAVASYKKSIEVTYGITVTRNGNPVEWIDSNGNVVQPFIYQDTAYVPLKTLAPEFGAATEYRYETNSVDIIDEARQDAFAMGYEFALKGYELAAGYEDILLERGVPLAYNKTSNTNTQSQGYYTGSNNNNYSSEDYENALNVYTDDFVYASDDPTIQKLMDEYLAAEEEYNRMYEEYLDMGMVSLDDISNGTTANYDNWLANYEAMGDILADMRKSNAQLLETIVSMTQANAGIYSEPSNKNNYSSPSYSSTDYVFPLHLYSNDGKVYLGKCTLDKYDQDSIWYTLALAGDYSSEYSDTSIWNKFSDYGGTLLSYDESAFNDRATNPPIIVDNNGAFIGYLTTNERIENGWTIAELRQFVENNE